MAEKTKENKSFSSIVSVDLASLQSYKYHRNEIKLHNLDKSSKSQEFFISYIYSKDIISASLEINRSIPDSDIQDAIEIKAYDELGLDTAIEYKITYFETETNDTKNRTYNVFAIDAALVSEQFGEIKKKTSYIDYITAAPFLVGSLYQKNILEPEGTECFVYFQKNDAFLTIYRGGEYLYSKSLRYSLIEINEKFCELMGERVDEQEFFDMLTSEGLKTSNISYQQYLMQLFGEIFLYINDVLIFAKRSYDIDTIDRLYIGSEIGTFSGIDEYSKSYLGLESSDFNFSIAINSKEWYIDQMHILMILAAQVYMDEPEDSHNFTVFRRPPAFAKRPSGKLMGIVAASLILSLAYPAYQYGYGYKLQYDYNEKAEEFKKLNQEASALKATLAKLKQEKDAINEKVAKQDEKLQFRKKLLDEIHDKKINYPMKGVILQDLITLINGRNVRISKVVDNDRNMTVSVVSRSDKKLTELLKDISESGKYSVSTKEIIKEDKKILYKSDVQVEIR